jgi:hypothetical protein
VAARQATARRAAVAADQLSESDDESSLAQQSEEEEQQSEEEQQEVDEFETAYDDAMEENGLDGASFEGDNTAVTQEDALPNDLIFSWETLPEDFQRPDNLPDPQYYSGEKGLKRGIANTFETPFESFMRVGGADIAFWRRLTANSNKHARRHCNFMNSVPYFAGSEWKPITVQEMIRAHGIMLRISCEPRALGGYHSYFCHSELSFHVSQKRHIHCPGFHGWAAICMSERRFKQIRSAMHPEDIRKEDDKCYQLRHAIRVFNQRSKIRFLRGAYNLPHETGRNRNIEDDRTIIILGLFSYFFPTLEQQ